MKRDVPSNETGKAFNASSTSTPPRLVRKKAREKILSDVGKLLCGRKFDSVDEVNSYLESIFLAGCIQLIPPITPLEEAQALISEAWYWLGERRVQLAYEALKISADCADAYVILAEAAQSLEEAKELYELGVEAGLRALGPHYLMENAGQFWSILETRPYMRAREGLAWCLWLLVERKKAIEHFTEMLRLNPGDNQGIRYALANCLLAESSDEVLGKLLQQYQGDATGEWLYTRALWVFRTYGSGEQANASLREALKVNLLVPLYLLSKKRLPRRLPKRIGWGDESEAVLYAAIAMERWQETPGALKWLTSQCVLNNSG